MASLMRRRLRLVAACTAVFVGGFGGWLWLRDSSLVAVQEVEVVGLNGRQAKEIEAALAASARGMTTLHVRSDELLQAAEPFPVVRSVRTETDLLHGLKIVVNAYEPVAALEVGGRRTAVAGDGTLLEGATIAGLPRVKAAAVAGGRVEDAETLRAVRLLDAAPAKLRDRVQRVFRGRRGLSATMLEGPKLYFGGGARFRAKWASAAQVLADDGARGASYIDVRLPARPTAGGLPPLPPEPLPEPPPESVTDPAATAQVPAG